MKKLFLLATVALLMSGSAAFANDGDKDKNKGKKTRTEKTDKKPCPTPCPKPCPPCCDKNKCDKS
jgi:hypothetical protein